MACILLANQVYNQNQWQSTEKKGMRNLQLSKKEQCETGANDGFSSYLCHCEESKCFLLGQQGCCFRVYQEWASSPTTGTKI